MQKNIAIIWDFDKTLTPIDSTSKTVEVLSKGKSIVAKRSPTYFFCHNLIVKTKNTKGWDTTRMLLFQKNLRE